MSRLRLRTRLVAAFVGIAGITTLLAALLTSWTLHRSFDDYLERRSGEAARSGVELAESAYQAGGGRWTPANLDLLSHELVLTGYDFRLIDDGRILLDTTRLERGGADFRRVAELPVAGPAGGSGGTLELYALGPGGNTPADDELRGELDRGHLIAAGIGGLVAIVAGLVVAGRLSRPLRHLAVAARDLATGGQMPPPLPGGSPEVRELSESLDGLAGDLERQRRARRQLAQDLSHELRTPLMLLQSRIEAMQDGVVPFDEEGLGLLHTETLRLVRLVGQIERLAEAEAQPAPLALGMVRLDELARELHAALAAAFEMRGIALELDAAPAPAHADLDATRQIVTNLLSNALKYAPVGHPVRLATTSEDGAAVVAVHDGGRELPAEDRQRVFERFYRGRQAARMSTGAGLGLTIARKLAEAQGGRLEMEVGAEGTSVVLRLPAEVVSSPPTR